MQTIFDKMTQALVPFSYGAFEQHGSDVAAFEPGKPNANCYNAVRALLQEVSDDIDGRDIYEVANQLEGYVGPDTPSDLAEFLMREGAEANALAEEIVRLRLLLARQEERQMFIAWNEGKSEGVVFDNDKDAFSALDGEPIFDPEIGFPAIACLAEKFYDVYGADACTVESVTIRSMP